jgi:hypothetical protein
MSMSRASLLATGLGLLVCTVASTGGAAQFTNGYGAFTPYPSHGSQECIQELWGGALNLCTTPSPLGPAIFELPISSGGIFAVSATAFAAGGTGSFNCFAVSISPNANQGAWGTTVTFNAGTESRTSFVTVPGGWSLRLQCDNIPLYRGIKSISWGLNES